MARKSQLAIGGEEEFREEMGRLIVETKDKHKLGYFRKWLKELEEYKKCYAEILTDKNSPDDYYVFRFTYVRKKPVWREILVRGSDTLNDLAIEAIYSMGWDNDHLHQFLPRTVNGRNLGFYDMLSIALGYPDDDEDWPSYRTQQVRITDIDWEKWPKWNFVFDFGDSHEFNVDFKRKLTEAQIRKEYYFEETPWLVDQRGVGPMQYPAYWEEEEDLDDAGNVC